MIKMKRDTFNKKVSNGQIQIGGLGVPEGVMITRLTKHWVWYVR